MTSKFCHLRVKWWMYVWCSGLLFMSCQHSVQQSKKFLEYEVEETLRFSFPFPMIPSMLTHPEERKIYFLKHYWDEFDFADTALVSNHEVTEQGFANQVSLLVDDSTSDDVIRESMKNWCMKFMSEVYASRVMMQLADNYLYNPNSSFYNEKLYGVYLEIMLEILSGQDARRSSLDFKLKLLKRNNVGDNAEDFVYYLPDGQKQTLLTTPVKGNRLLLVFYDPECESCHQALCKMMEDVSLNKAVESGKITVLAVYTEGNEKIWKRGLVDMPEDWIVGADRQQVKEKTLYDLKAMPSFYLLDEKKRVLLKDASLGQILERLNLQ